MSKEGFASHHATEGKVDPRLEKWREEIEEERNGKGFTILGSKLKISVDFKVPADYFGRFGAVTYYNGCNSRYLFVCYKSKCSALEALVDGADKYDLRPAITRTKSSDKNKPNKTDDIKNRERFSGGVHRSCDEDNIKALLQDYPEAAQYVDELVRDINGRFTVVVPEKHFKDELEAQNLFDRFGVIVNQSVSSKFIFFRYGSKLNAFTALCKTINKYETRPALPEENFEKHYLYNKRNDNFKNNEILRKRFHKKAQKQNLFDKSNKESRDECLAQSKKPLSTTTHDMKMRTKEWNPSQNEECWDSDGGEKYAEEDEKWKCQYLSEALSDEKWMQRGTPVKGKIVPDSLTTERNLYQGSKENNKPNGFPKECVALHQIQTYSKEELKERDGGHQRRSRTFHSKRRDIYQKDMTKDKEKYIPQEQDRPSLADSEDGESGRVRMDEAESVSSVHMIAKWISRSSGEAGRSQMNQEAEETVPHPGNKSSGEMKDADDQLSENLNREEVEKLHLKVRHQERVMIVKDATIADLKKTVNKFKAQMESLEKELRNQKHETESLQILADFYEQKLKLSDKRVLEVEKELSALRESQTTSVSHST